jgi:DNA mismatch repair protein MutS2
MNTKYLKILEYDKIIENLSNYCKTYIGKEKAKNLLPSFSKLEVLDLLELTNESTSLIYKKSNIPLSELPNISLYIKSLESNSLLTNKSLLDIARFLKISREVKEYFFKDDNLNSSEYKSLYSFFNNIYTNKSVEDKIFSIVLDENTIADDASQVLSSLRKQSKKIEQALRDKLTSFIHSNTYSKYLMEPIITIRSDRYVVPVKEEYKSQVKGFIHDISSSGSTVFIEPISVFELNNNLANIKVEEDIEIEKILSSLSTLLNEYTDELKYNINILGELDLIFAKANYSIELDGINPNINDEKYIDLKSAKHPLIQKDVVVPIDISIGKDYSSLVITGPNTGGKTVSLKTTGILLLMAYSGIFIPAKESSSIYVFDNIFADIGDEQSIQESLSTFSSHMSTIVEITNKATSNSLILLDELRIWN